MSDIFKLLCQDITQEKKFGICDDIPNHRAYVDLNNGSKWMTVVQNNSMLPVTFTALDNCIELRGTDGKMESRCEGIITYGNTIIFIEIKERTGDSKTWAKDADKQLRATISSIKSKINLDSFETKRAAITNRLQSRSKEKHTVRMKKFLEDTGYLLSVDNRIKIE